MGQHAMTEHKIVFDDGAAYERMMGTWSRIAGDVFLDWLAPPSGLRWIDVGCGNGAFTELVVERCAPKEIQGVDPSDAQLAFARTRHKAGLVTFQQGDAMALPFPDNSFDAAVMALVLFFVPDPAKGVTELTRVVKPGGLVCAYLWDIPGRGLPMAPIGIELRAIGVSAPMPPSADVSRMETLHDVWTKAGLEAIETREITVQRSFDSFEDFWTINISGSTMRDTIAGMPAHDVDALKERVRARLPADANGRVTCSARANAIKGRAPK